MKMGLARMVQAYREKSALRRFQKENKWETLVPGDVVEYKGQRYMYRGINKNGGPGMPGLPEPHFGLATPSKPDRVWYLRNEFSYPFSEDLPDIMKESTQPVQAGNTGVYVAFLNASRSDLTKVGHITPGGWKNMVQELRKN